MIPNSSLIVSPTEPQGKNRKKVWMKKTDTDKKIYIKNSNDVYEEFIRYEIERINITLSDDVESGNVLCLKCGKVVIVEVSDLKLKTDKREWDTIIAYGLPKQSNKYNTWIKSILLDGKGDINTGNNVLNVSERTGIQKASSIYIGQLIYLTD